MADRWTSRALVHNWPGLVRLSGCADDTEFEAVVRDVVETDADVMELEDRGGIVDGT